MKMIATLHVDAIARGGQALSCPCSEGKGWAIVVVGMTGPLDGNACIAGPTMETAAQVNSRALFTLVDDLPPPQGAQQCAQQSCQLGSLPLDPFCAFITF
jgi:hypothetical protein